MNNTLVFKKLN